MDLAAFLDAVFRGKPGFDSLCFGYAIIRYRLMDVDIIFKRGLAYTAATGGVAAVYFRWWLWLAGIFHAADRRARSEA